MPALSFYIDPQDIEENVAYFTRYQKPAVVRALARLLKVWRRATGIRAIFFVPDSYASYPPEVVKALRVAQKAKDAGVITKFFETDYIRYPDEPPMTHMWVAVLSYKLKNGDANQEPRSTQRWQRGYGGFGYHYHDSRKAVLSAIGEGIERWSLAHFIPPKKESRLATIDEIKALGLEFIHPDDVIGYDQGLRECGHPRYRLAIGDDDKFLWVKGKSMITGKKSWIPAQLVSFAHQGRYLSRRKEPLILLSTSNGAAAHTVFDDAVSNALLEVVQRDAFMVHWLNKTPLAALDIKTSNDDTLRSYHQLFSLYGLEARVFYLPSDMPVHIVLAVIVDRSGVGPRICVGAAAARRVEEAAFNALQEAAVSRLSIRDLMVEYSAQSRQFNLSPESLDHEGRLLYWALKKDEKDIDFMWENGRRESFASFSAFPYASARETVRALLNSLKIHGHAAHVVDISTPPIKRAGFCACVAVIPTMHPLHLDESLPCFDVRRVKKCLDSLGLPFSGAINREPHPFP